MRRKFSRNCSLSVVAPFIAILILLIAAAVLAQTSGTGQPTGKANAVLAQAGTPASVQAQRPLSPWTGAGSSPVSRSHKERRGPRPMDGGPPLFMPAVTYGSGGSGGATSVAVGDVNLDGHPDLVVANQSPGTVSVLLGNGDGTFRAAVTYDSGAGSPESVVVADVNGDGKPDLIVANLNTDTAGVLLGNGDGTFQPVVTYNGLGGWAIAVADVNGDGKPDLIAGAGAVGVALGNGDGTFQSPVFYDPGGAYFMAVAVADVNHDGKPDLIVANWCVSYSNCANGTVGVLLGNGDGTFQPTVSYDSGGTYAWSVAVADVTGDGKPDLVVANWGSNTVGVLLGNGDGTFQPAVTYDSSGGYPVSLAVADVNGDGKPDLVAANDQTGTVDILLGNGDGTFQPVVTYSSGGQGAVGSQSLVVADLNGDGKEDLAVTNFGGDAVGVLLHTNPTTTALVSSPNPSGYGQAVTFTATVSTASGTPTGTVIFYDGSTAIGSATLANGSASLSTSSLAAGSHTITAAYQGSGAFQPSTSAPLNQVVNPATTTTSLVSSLNPARVKQSVTYTATVTSQYGGAATGTVAFKDNGATIATVALSGNQAAYSTMYKKGGSHAITATYSGDADNLGSTSATLTEYIASVASKTKLTSSGSPSYVGQPVTFTATVTSKHGAIPDGELVTFYEWNTQLASVALAGGIATYITSFSKSGGYAIKAIYPGDAVFAPSSGSMVQRVQKYATTTWLSSSPNPSQYGQPVTFTITVGSEGGPVPTGSVQVFDGNENLAFLDLTNGTASFTDSTLSPRTHRMHATYMGDQYSSISRSPYLQQVVEK